MTPKRKFPKIVKPDANECFGGPSPEGDANAFLIAAAPDLLEALQRIANEPCDHGPQDFCPREIAQAAIRKATGGDE